VVVVLVLVLARVGAGVVTIAMVGAAVIALIVEVVVL
jgi:hypothetical protein